MINKINEDRLMKNLFSLAEIGMNENGGIDRALGSKADQEARQWLMKYWRKALCLETTIDPIANLWITWEGTEELSPIVIGSHHDAVPDGGKYDGAMGVLIATEILETLVENQIRLRHPVKVISFTGEEPNPFNLSTLGSKVLSGRLVKEDLENCNSRQTGESLKDAIRSLGGNIDYLEEARLKPGSIAAFMEAHNELGRHLEEEKLSIGCVSCITGIYREEIIVFGEANHAGTTMMQDRKDAMVGLSQFTLALNQIAEDYKDPDVVATLGYVKIEPNEANIIPGKATAILDVRTCKGIIKDEIVEKIGRAVDQIQKKCRVVIVRKVLLDQPERILDEDVKKAIDVGIAMEAEPPFRMVSMAGHDAANMQLLTKSGMIFVQSVGGKGHCRQEYSKKEDITKAANAMFTALLKLDKELD